MRRVPDWYPPLVERKSMAACPCVIASGAKQSRARGRTARDCFVTSLLAMTELAKPHFIEPHLIDSCCWPYSATTSFLAQPFGGRVQWLRATVELAMATLRSVRHRARSSLLLSSASRPGRFNRLRSIPVRPAVTSRPLESMISVHSALRPCRAHRSPNPRQEYLLCECVAVGGVRDERGLGDDLVRVARRCSAGRHEDGRDQHRVQPDDPGDVGHRDLGAARDEHRAEFQRVVAEREIGAGQWAVPCVRSW
jgi:hypothetical protein